MLSLGILLPSTYHMICKVASLEWDLEQENVLPQI